MKIKLLAISFLFITNMFLASNGQAFILSDEKTGEIVEKNDALGINAGFDTSATVSDVIAIVIQVFLSLLGIIFIILILYAGFLWMTAGGEEEKIKKAKDIISRAIIGLVIITAAYAITYFVFNNLLSGTDGGGGGRSEPG